VSGPRLLDLAACVSQVIDRTVELCAVPGPPLDEADRAAVVERWWLEDGLEPRVDAAGNVWAMVRPGLDVDGPAVVVAAHLDTVFPRSVVHGVTRDGDLLVGPGVGDDTVALAALGALRSLLPETDRPVWLLATVGEEGLGDLRGIRHALAEPVVPIAVVVAVEGNYLGRVCHVGVGSVRERITISTSGGHAWEAADAPSAVHHAAGVVAGIAGLARPEGRPRRAVNVGRLCGGEAINARARMCSFEVDLRSDDPDELARLAADTDAVIVSTATDTEVSVTREGLGARPAGALPADHWLVRVACEAQAAAGVTARLVAASTDANAALAAGLPAVAVGVVVGAQEHTEAEWIDLATLPAGLASLTETVAGATRKDAP
jgi:tripeptide aminopeptidase